jgi:hypothetical protein
MKRRSSTQQAVRFAVVAGLLVLVGLVTLGFAVLINASFIPTARAQTNPPCRPQGATRGCSANGKPGQQLCDGGVWTFCKANPPPPPPPVSGTVTPKYYILTVIYAPPGTNGGKSSSSVSYGSGSSTGSTVSASNSFKQSNTITATTEGGITGVVGTQAEASFGVTHSSSNSSSLDIKRSSTSEINDVGPAADGINHDHDLIYLWLNPTVQLKLFPTVSGTVSSVVWQPVNTSQTVVTYVYVGWLKNPSQIPPGELQLLQRYGITPQDFPEMLKADPFANTSRFSSVLRTDTVPDPRRFQPLFTTFPYEPPFGPGDPVPTFKFTTTYTNTAGTSFTAQSEYTVGLKLQATGGFFGLAKLTLKDQANWTWTSTDTRSSSTGTTESASVTVGGPAFGYQGPTDMVVYYDVIYKTFLFAPLPTTSPPLLGSVATSAGRLVSGKEVIVVANGVRYRTFTNAKGQYRVFGNISGPLRVQVDTVRKELPQLPATRKVDIVLPR